MNYMICTSEQTEKNNFYQLNTVSAYYREIRQASVLNLLFGSVLEKNWLLKVTDEKYSPL